MGMKGGIEILAAPINKTKFNFIKIARGIPINNWNPHIGITPIKQPNAIDKDLLKFDSSDLTASFLITFNVLIEKSLLG